MKKQLRIYTITILCLLFVSSFLSCKPDSLPTTATPIGYLHNQHLHFHSIPRPCKRVEVHANGSVALRKVSTIKPDDSRQTLEGDTATFYFTPDMAGHYVIEYEYTYTNHFEHLVPENPEVILWEEGTYPFDVKNPTIPKGYSSFVSSNGFITIHYPTTTFSHFIHTILEIKPTKKASILSIEIKDYAVFPEAYSFSAKEKVMIQFNQERDRFKKGIRFQLHDKANRDEIVDSLDITKEIEMTTIEKISFIPQNDDLIHYLTQSIYFLEEGNLKLWNFKENKVSVLTNDQFYHHFTLSPDRTHIALSTATDTYLSDFEGNNLHKIFYGYHQPIFINDVLLLMVGANEWSESKTATYGDITIQNNVYQMPLVIYSLTNNEITTEAKINVFLGERWSMYHQTFADLSVNLVPFERSKDEYLIKVISPGLEPKWILIRRKSVIDYTQENTPWIEEKPYVFSDFAFEGDIQPAILMKETNNNHEEVLYLEKDYVALSLPEEKYRYLSFVRTVKDKLSAPSFYIETNRELCVFDKILKTTYTLPISAIDASRLGAK